MQNLWFTDFFFHKIGNQIFIHCWFLRQQGPLLSLKQLYEFSKTQ